MEAAKSRPVRESRGSRPHWGLGASGRSSSQCVALQCRKDGLSCSSCHARISAGARAASSAQFPRARVGCPRASGSYATRPVPPPPPRRSLSSLVALHRTARHVRPASLRPVPRSQHLVRLPARRSPAAQRSPTRALVHRFMFLTARHHRPPLAVCLPYARPAARASKSALPAESPSVARPLSRCVGTRCAILPATATCGSL